MCLPHPVRIAFAAACLSFVHSQALADWIDRESCPITIASSDGVPGPTRAPDNMAWFGSDALAVLIPRDGHWIGMGPERNFGNKLWWWSASLDLGTEYQPELSILARRLDAPAPDVHIPRATNATLADGDAMLVGLGFPTDGCWEVSGRYKGQIVSFVVMVGGESSG